MKGQHKTLPDGTGTGMGQILANNLQKGNFKSNQRGACHMGAVYTAVEVTAKKDCTRLSKAYPTKIIVIINHLFC